MATHLSPLDPRSVRRQLPQNDIHRISHILLKSDNENRFMSDYRSHFNEQQEVQMPTIGKTLSPAKKERNLSPMDLQEDSPGFPSAGVRSALFHRAPNNSRLNDLGISPKKKLLKEGVPFSQNIPSILISSQGRSPKFSNLIKKNSSVKQLRNRPRPIVTNDPPAAGLPNKFMFISESNDNLHQGLSGTLGSGGGAASFQQQLQRSFHSFENLPKISQSKLKRKLPALEPRAVVPDLGSQQASKSALAIKEYGEELPVAGLRGAKRYIDELPALQQSHCRPIQAKPPLAAEQGSGILPAGAAGEAGGSSQQAHIPQKQNARKDYSTLPPSFKLAKDGHVVRHFNYDRSLACHAKDVNAKSEAFYNY